MRKNFTAVFAVCLAVSSLPLACGDDEDDGGGSGGDNGGGSGGKGTGGGKATGGSSGSAGTGTGGKAGSTGTGGKATGGATSTGGTMSGGVGGADDGGMGGEGGSGGPTTFDCAALCERVTAVTDCDDDSMCESEVCVPSPGPLCDDEVQTFHDFAGNADASNFTCLMGKPIYNYGSGDCDMEFEAAAMCIPI